MGDTPQTAESHEQAGRGHWTMPHPADLRIEAWGPTREDCLAEAVLGLVDSFAVVAGRPLPGRAERDLRCAPDPAGRWTCAVTVDV
jgi:SHS2 domain-containing protein